MPRGRGGQSKPLHSRAPHERTRERERMLHALRALPAAARRLVSSPRGGLVAAAAALAVPAAVWAAHARSAASAPSAELERVANTPPKGALEPTEFRGFTLLSVTPLTGDTAKYTFALPRENDELGLVTASCLVVKGEVDGEYGWGGRGESVLAAHVVHAGCGAGDPSPAAAASAATARARAPSHPMGMCSSTPPPCCAPLAAQPV